MTNDMTKDFYLGQLLYAAVIEDDAEKSKQHIKSARSLAQFLPDTVVEEAKTMVRGWLEEEINA